MYKRIARLGAYLHCDPACSNCNNDLSSLLQNFNTTTISIEKLDSEWR